MTFDSSMPYPYHYMTNVDAEKLMDSDCTELRHSCIWGPFALTKRAAELKSPIAAIRESETNFSLIDSTLRSVQVLTASNLSSCHRNILVSSLVFDVLSFYNRIELHPAIYNCKKRGVNIGELYRASYQLVVRDQTISISDANRLDVFFSVIFSCNGEIDVLKTVPFFEDLTSDAAELLVNHKTDSRVHSLIRQLKSLGDNIASSF